MTHELASIRLKGCTHVAACECGDRFKASTPEAARLGWYMHRIRASKPACPHPQKKRYGTRVEAENAIRRQIRTVYPGRRPSSAYRCPSGQHWHTTSTPEPQRRLA